MSIFILINILRRKIGDRSGIPCTSRPVSRISRLCAQDERTTSTGGDSIRLAPYRISNDGPDYSSALWEVIQGCGVGQAPANGYRDVTEEGRFLFGHRLRTGLERVKVMLSALEPLCSSRAVLQAVSGGESVGLCLTLLHLNHQTIEEGAVKLNGLAEIFSGGGIQVLAPVALQRAVFVYKHLGDLFDHPRYRSIRLLNSRAWFVPKLALDLVPAYAEMLWFLTIKQDRRWSAILDNMGFMGDRHAHWSLVDKSRIHRDIVCNRVRIYCRAVRVPVRSLNDI